MVTGRDIAQFISQQTGDDFVSFYDQGVEQENNRMEEEKEIKKKFWESYNRMNKALLK